MQAMLFLNFSTGPFESFKSVYYGAAEEFKDKEIKFLIGDLEASQGAFQVCFLTFLYLFFKQFNVLNANFKSITVQYFGLREDQVPLIIIQDGDSKKFLKAHVEPDQIVSWLKQYFVSSLLYL